MVPSLLAGFSPPGNAMAFPDADREMDSFASFGFDAAAAPSGGPSALRFIASLLAPSASSPAAAVSCSTIFGTRGSTPSRSLSDKSNEIVARRAHVLMLM